MRNSTDIQSEIDRKTHELTQLRQEKQQALLREERVRTQGVAVLYPEPPPWRDPREFVGTMG